MNVNYFYNCTDFFRKIIDFHTIRAKHFLAVTQKTNTIKAIGLYGLVLFMIMFCSSYATENLKKFKSITSKYS